MDLSSLTGPPELASRLAERPLVLLVARNSSQGSKARSYAAEELVKAVEGLTVLTGLNFTPHLPSPETLRARIKSAPVLKSKMADGSTFSHKIITIDDALEAGLVVVIGTGTGRKTDDAGAQPFVSHLVEEIRARKPALIFANRFDRFLRSTGAAMLLHEVCTSHDVLMGDAQDGIHAGGDVSQVMNFFKAFSAEREAKGIPVKTRQAMMMHSGRKMKDGKVPFAAQMSPPPGLTRIRLKSETGSVGPAYLFLDSPKFYPPQTEVAGGLPAVKRGRQLVDQMALVCWALENLGKPGNTKASVGRELAKRGFSTCKYRDVHGMSASYPTGVDSTRAYLPVRAITDNLEFYETGKLTVNVGGDAKNEFVVTDCLPPRGYWAKPADFARIRAYIAEIPKKSGNCLMSLVGVSVSVAGIDGYLGANGDGTYKVRYPSKNGKRLAPCIPHEVLADIVAEGLMEAAGQVFIPLVPQDSPEVAQMRTRMEDAQSRADEATRKAAVLRGQLLETDEDGLPILPATVRRELGAEWETLLVSAESLRAKAATLSRQLTQAVASSSGSRGAPVNRLLVLLESLRDPSRVEFNLEWKSTLTFQFLPRLRNHNGLRDNWVEICGTLRIQHDGHTFVVPLHGKYQRTDRANPLPRAQAIKDEMLQGVPYWQTNTGMKVHLRPHVAKLFGVDPAYFALSTCPNGRITRVGATCMAHPRLSAKKVAEDLGEPVALVRAVKNRLDAPLRKTSWLRTASPIINVFTKLAHRGGGVVELTQVREHINDAPQAWAKLKGKPEGEAWQAVSPGVYELAPCAACGHRVRYANRLHGVTGWVCDACRTDDAGVVWGTDIDEWRY